MNSYENLKAHLVKHVYMRGEFKGDAPLGKRSKNWMRVMERNGDMVVRMRNSDLITVRPDNTFTLRANGWWGSPTTRDAFKLGFGVMGLRAYVYSKKTRGLNTSYVNLRGINYEVYEGMEFDAEGVLVSAPKTPRARRINRNASKEFQKALKDSGFKDMFKVLFATAPAPERGRRYLRASELRAILTDPDSADKWTQVMQDYAYEQVYSYQTYGYGYVRKTVNKVDPDANNRWRSYKSVPQTAEECWREIMAECKKDMYDVVEVQPEANI